MTSTKRRRSATLVTILVGMLTVALFTSTSANASASDSIVNWFAPNDTSYTVAMPTYDGSGGPGRFEVQPGDPNQNRASTGAFYYPGTGSSDHTARLILNAWYSAGFGYYWFYVHCNTTIYRAGFDANTIIGRGSFIPDYQRPYVGIFYQPDGNLVMYKYAKDSAGNRTDSWVIGALYTQPGGSTSFNAFGTFVRGPYVSNSHC